MRARTPSLPRSLPSFLVHRAGDMSGHPHNRDVWTLVSHMKDVILKLLQSPNDGIRTQVIKFVQKLIYCMSDAPTVRREPRGPPGWPCPLTRPLCAQRARGCLAERRLSSELTGTRARGAGNRGRPVAQLRPRGTSPAGPSPAGAGGLAAPAVPAHLATVPTAVRGGRCQRTRSLDGLSRTVARRGCARADSATTAASLRSSTARGRGV